jgi:hypothetical protein
MWDRKCLREKRERERQSENESGRKTEREREYMNVNVFEYMPYIMSFSLFSLSFSVLGSCTWVFTSARGVPAWRSACIHSLLRDFLLSLWLALSRVHVRVYVRVR